MMNVKNRKCIRRLSFRSIWASRKRNIIAIIAIILTTLLFTALFTVSMSINSSYQTYTFRQIGGYNHGTFKDVTDEQIAAISAHSKVKATGERKLISVLSDGVFSKVPAEISFMEENCAKWSYAEPTEGRLPQSGMEIAMDTNALSLLGIDRKLGAEVTLTYTVEDVNMKKYEKTDTFNLVGWWEYDDISPVHYINVSEEYVDSVETEAVAAGLDPFYSDLNVMMASSVDIRGQMEQVDKDLGYSWENRNEADSARIGVNWGYTSYQLGESMDAGMILAIVSLLVLVIFTGYLIIYNIFQISVTGDIRFYGLLKTIGVTPKQLRRIIRQQALFLCVIGIPVGLLLGYVIGAVLTPVVMKNTSLGADVSTISTSPFIFVVAALFALVTVLLSCARPGRIAAKVSPVEATKYTEAVQGKKKRRVTRGAKVYQMAFANLGRNKKKTILVIISLALSVVLLNVLVVFVNGFDMEKYMDKQTCADFIVSSTDYFRYNQAEEYISQNEIMDIADHTTQTSAGSGYVVSGTNTEVWIGSEEWKNNQSFYFPEDEIEDMYAKKETRDGMVSETAIIEGLDEELFQKLTVLEGDLSQLFKDNSNSIALTVDDDYGNISNYENYPALGDSITVRYISDAYYIDSRTGDKCDENTPDEFREYFIADSHDVEYTVCAYVAVPYSMSMRYSLPGGYSMVLPVDRLAEDSMQSVIPLFYLFDTPDSEAENEAEEYLADLTSADLSRLMYESKATLRAEFENFQKMFLLLGGLLCAIIGLVGILNFFNAIMTGILSRKREFAVLQSVGMTNKQLKNMLVYEGLFYALSASVFALILSVILNPLASKILENMFWFFSAGFTILPVLFAIPVFTLLGWLIPSVMYGQTAKHSIVERLREAE
ncbi:MAG: ABC transporter permease [Coprococcus sp.]